MSAEPSGEPAATGTALDEKLQAFVGMVAGEPNRAPDPVNLPMIRHWVEAMGDFNPVYVDEEAARRFGFPGIVAPPTMLQAWIMRGLRISLEVEAARSEGRSPRSDSPTDNLMSLLDEAGFTSVVATNCDQHYERSILLGDALSVTSTIAAVSSEKKTALGLGHFITTRLEYHDEHGELVGTMHIPDPQIQTGGARRRRGRRRDLGGVCTGHRAGPSETTPTRAHPGQPFLL